MERNSRKISVILRNGFLLEQPVLDQTQVFGEHALEAGQRVSVAHGEYCGFRRQKPRKSLNPQQDSHRLVSRKFNTHAPLPLFQTDS
jgi:hypothetical protein